MRDCDHCMIVAYLQASQCLACVPIIEIIHAYGKSTLGRHVTSLCLWQAQSLQRLAQSTGLFEVLPRYKCHMKTYPHVASLRQLL